jgi:hypothetical protein
MDRERMAVTAESYGIRGRSLMRTAIQLLGVAAVLVGAFNYLLAPVVEAQAIITIYRTAAFDYLAFPSSMLADIALMVVGAIVAWSV